MKPYLKIIYVFIFTLLFSNLLNAGTFTSVQEPSIFILTAMEDNMEIKEKKLRNIIREEISNVINEDINKKEV